MFAADEGTASNLQRLAKWAGRVSTKYKGTAQNISNVKSAIKDIRQSSRPVDMQATQEGEYIQSDGSTNSYMYIGAGLLIAVGLGYVIYKKVSN